jgi:hypothetical protein
MLSLLKAKHIEHIWHLVPLTRELVLQTLNGLLFDSAHYTQCNRVSRTHNMFLHFDAARHGMYATTTLANFAIQREKDLLLQSKTQHNNQTKSNLQ